MKKYLLRLLAVTLPLAAFLMLAAPAFAQAVTFDPEKRYKVGTGPGAGGTCGDATGELCSLDIVSADFDSDGNLDLATANSFGTETGDVTVFLNNGDGTYDSGHPFPAGIGAFSIDVGYFNNDTKPDIVTTDVNSGTPAVVVLLNTTPTNGALSFAPPQTTPSGGDGPADVAVGDFDQDGFFNDLAVTNAAFNVSSPGTTGVAILRNVAHDGTFQPGGFLIYPTPRVPQYVDVGNFNGDNDPDLVVTNDDNTASVFVGTPGTGFNFKQDIKTGDGPDQVDVADLNGDGKDDIAVANQITNDVTVALGNGDGTFKKVGEFPLPSGGTTPADLVVGNFNNDCPPDIAVANFGSDNVSVLTGDGKGNFSAAQNFPVGTDPIGMAKGDFDHKNGPDLATANFSSDDISVLLNASPKFFCVPPTLTKTDSPDPVNVGENLTYTLTLTNNAPGTAQDVVITDTLPAGVTFVSASPGCTNSNNTVTCKIGSLAGGATATKEIVVRVDQAGPLTNTAKVESSSVPSANATATTATVDDNLSLTKADSPDPVKVRSNVTYTLTLTNMGSGDANDVTITDSLPAGVTLVSASSDCTPNPDGTVTCNVGTLASGKTATEQIVVKVRRKGKLTNTAIAQSSTGSSATAIANTKVQKDKRHKNQHGKHKHRR